MEVVPGHAEGLPPADANGKSDPFVSVQLVGKQFSRWLSDFVVCTQTTFAFEELTLKTEKGRSTNENRSQPES